MQCLLCLCRTVEAGTVCTPLIYCGCMLCACISHVWVRSACITFLAETRSGPWSRAAADGTEHCSLYIGGGRLGAAQISPIGSRMEQNDAPFEGSWQMK